ncbi:hypothetical protein CC78DRAFT_277612 [Lojkania enalia]|uniref:Uncharacterized protein n=1 Tax=Lojkania enalia TaxID=147567 RepID=A0A9P4N9X6_9PLEO|nr:hypothetical protein CC78DRAFT_277612 [Didymosphaeria enalia]
MHFVLASSNRHARPAIRNRYGANANPSRRLSRQQSMTPALQKRSNPSPPCNARRNPHAHLRRRLHRN